MRYVFLQFHGMELLLTVTCAITHVIGFRHLNEPFPHEFYFCGLYFMFILLNSMTIFGIFCGLPISTGYEAIVSFLAAIGFLVAAFWSMEHAENDIHLTFLSGDEEFQHYFFKTIRLQSIFSITAGYLYLLHSMLCIDVYLAIQKLHGEPPPLPPPEDEFTEPEKDHHPTELFIAFKPFANWLSKEFPRLCQYVAVDEKEPQLRIEV